MRRLLLAVLLLSAGAARAQFDAKALIRNQYGDQRQDAVGTNPFGQQDGQQQQPQDPADTTTRKKRPKRALESYFFSDSVRALRNWQWTSSEDYNRVQIEPLDTTLALWRVDYPVYKRGVGSAFLGGLGQAAEPYSYKERVRSTTDMGFASPFEAYTFRRDNVPFYNSKTPYFNFHYLESGNKQVREENFSATVAHSITPSTSANIQYRARGTRGIYPSQDTKNHNLSIAAAHTGKRYTVHAGYINNRMTMRENGGAVGAWAVRDTTWERYSLMPMKLKEAQAKNEHRNNAFYITQSYGIPFLRIGASDFSIAEVPAVFIGHSFQYNAWSKIYSDTYKTYADPRHSRDASGNWQTQEGLEYYAHWYINPEQSRDSLYERVISNRLFMQLQPWDRNGVVGTLDGGVGLDLKTYSQFELSSYLTGRYAHTRREDYFGYAAVEGRLRRYMSWGADARYYFAGSRTQDFALDAHLALTGFLRGKPMTLTGRFTSRADSPTYWQEHLYTNHYIFNQSLSKEKETRFEVSFAMPAHAFEVSFSQSVTTDKIYLERYQTAVLPRSGISEYIWDVRQQQASGTVGVTELYVRKDFRFAGVHLDHKILAQTSTNQSVITVPTVTAFLSYYYQFWAVRDVLELQLGIDARWNTRYNAPGYNPALGRFYNQAQEKVGGYPYCDLFVTAKWKRARVFLKYQHINRGLFGNGEYFAVAGYPLNPGMFKFGISWGFYD